MANFWCQYTCSPNQSAFVQTRGFEQKVDPVSGATMTVLHSVTAVSRSFACGAYASCAFTGKVKEFPPMQNCEGFFTYQGETEAIQDGSTFIDFNYSEPVGAQLLLTAPLHSCCNFNLSTDAPAPLQPLQPLPPGTPNNSCPCASCKAMCSGGSCGGGGAGGSGLGAVNSSVLRGFNALTVGVFWALLLVVGTTVLVARRLLGCEKRPWEAAEGLGGCAPGELSTASVLLSQLLLGAAA